MKKLFLLLICTTFLIASSLPVNSSVKLHSSTSSSDTSILGKQVRYLDTLVQV